MTGLERQATALLATANSELVAHLPMSDQRDVESASRGLISTKKPGAVTNAAGDVVWDCDAYSFLDDDRPDTANPSLWRQSALVTKHGLFEVVPGIYQVRGMDVSNISFIEGDTGVLIIDPLISTETAAAALEIYRAHRGDRVVTAVIYTHSHVDHFGGVKGVVDQADVDAGKVTILAPAGFMEHAIEENVYAGTAMGRRAAYMYGAALPKGPRGSIGAGLGQTTSTGTITLIPPTLEIHTTGQEETVDGIRIIFQMTPGTEAPSEMNLFFPDRAALCMAENATHTLHNLLTLRGAVVRDPHVWSSYLTESINLFATKADVVFASHHWPTWGRETLLEFLSAQRDLYGYLHDQTLRMINQGYTGSEIAERIVLPPAMEQAWSARGYYGSVSHNVKAIYQRYMGWFDGSPARLWQHPPAESSQRHVEYMGGADEVLRRAQQSYDDGDYRWVAQVLDYVIFADPDNAAAKTLQADTLEQLGYGSENGTWRNFFLTGAYELRHGSVGTPITANAPDLAGALTLPQIFDTIALRIDGPKAWDASVTIDWHLTDLDVRYRCALANGVLVHYTLDGSDHGAPDATFTLTRPQLLGVVGGAISLTDALSAEQITVAGDPASFGRLAGFLDKPDPDFAIVTP